MPGAELRVRVGGKAYAAGPILGPIAFRASAGEIVALLAPSGTGKTTLLNLVLGLDRQFEGEIFRPPGPIAAVFQEPRLLPWLTLAENLRLVAPTLTAGKVAQALNEVGLDGACAALRPGQVSLGMARRVAMARALATQPALLVLDEPFASLDASAASGLARLVSAHARVSGTIALMATHDLDQAVAIANRVIVLQGRPARLVRDETAPSGALLRDAFPFLAG